jgi:hypothetical protein
MGIRGGPIWADCSCLISSFIRPVMETGYIATANACASAKTLLQRVQNSALRAIYRPPPRTRMKDLHARAGLIEISERLQHPRERAIPRYENSSLISRMKDKVTIIAPRPTPAHDTESKRATMSSTRPLSPLTSERAITRLLIS